MYGLAHQTHHRFPARLWLVKLFGQSHSHLARTATLARTALGENKSAILFYSIRPRFFEYYRWLPAFLAAPVNRADASRTKSMVMARPVKLALAITRFRAPSSSRTLERKRLAIKKATSSARRIWWSSSLFSSKSPLEFPAPAAQSQPLDPQPNETLRRSSTPSDFAWIAVRR